MATEKTPDYKRIARAEASAVEWKMKATERREKIEALKGQLANASEKIKDKNTEIDEEKKHCEELEKQLKELTEQLRLATEANSTLQTAMEQFKKKV